MVDDNVESSGELKPATWKVAEMLSFANSSRATIAEEMSHLEKDLIVSTIDTLPNPKPSIEFVAKSAREGVAPSRTIGVCMPQDFISPGAQPGDGQGTIEPNYQAVNYFALFEKRDVDLPPIGAARLIVGPRHGTVSRYTHPSNGIESYRYVPNAGFVGNDRIEFFVYIDRISVRVVYFFKVTKINIDAGSASRLCTQFEWRIYSSSAYPITVSDAVSTQVAGRAAYPAALMRLTDICSLLAEAALLHSAQTDAFADAGYQGVHRA